jgi:hypothetical protein
MDKRFYTWQEKTLIKLCHPNSISKLNILWHNRNSLSMNCAEIGIFKQSEEVGLNSFLKSWDGALESNRRCVLKSWAISLTNLWNGALCSSGTFGSPLEPPETVRLLHAVGGRSRLPSCLCLQLLPRSLTSNGFPCELLCTTHLNYNECLLLADWNENWDVEATVC